MGSRDGLEVNLPEMVCKWRPLMCFCLYSYASSSMLYKWNYTLCSLLRLIFFHLVLMYLRFIHIVAFISSLFLFITEYYSIVWILFIHSQLKNI